MAPGDPDRASLGRFAAGVAGLPVEPEPARSLAAVLRKLRDDDFLPDPLAHEALLALAGRPVEPGSLLAEAAAGVEEFRLHGEVESFAAGFFDVSPPARAGRWEELARSCSRHPRLVERLEALKPGLAVERAAVVDPSPASKRLLDDLLALFPLQPEARAPEARARRERFLNDPSLTPAQRARALRRVARNHRAVAALSQGYLESMAKPRRKSRAAQGLARFARGLGAALAERRLLLVLLGVSLGGSVLRSIQTHPAKVSTIPDWTIRVPAEPSTTGGPGPRLDDARMNSAIRDEFKGIIRGEVRKLGGRFDEEKLDEAVRGLPVEELPKVGGLGSVVVFGEWPRELHARFVDRLKVGLKSSDLTLTERELDDLARRCLPSTAGGVRARPRPR